MSRPIGIILFATLIRSAFAQTPINVEGRLAADVSFDHMSTALSAAEKQRLVVTIDTVKKAEYCPFAAAVVTGHADRDEGNTEITQHLSSERADLVADLLRAHGVPAGLIIVGYQGTAEPVVAPPNPKNSRVELEFIGGAYPGTPCAIPMTSSGFRVMEH